MVKHQTTTTNDGEPKKQQQRNNTQQWNIVQTKKKTGKTNIKMKRYGGTDDTPQRENTLTKYLATQTTLNKHAKNLFGKNQEHETNTQMEDEEENNKEEEDEEEDNEEIENEEEQSNTSSKQSELEESSEYSEVEITDDNVVQITKVTLGTKRWQEQNKPLEEISEDETTSLQKTASI